MGLARGVRLWSVVLLVMSGAALASCGNVASVLGTSITDPFPWTYGGSGTMTYRGGIECSGPAELALTITDKGATFTITSHKAVASVSVTVGRETEKCIDYDSTGTVEGVHYIRGYDDSGDPRGDLETYSGNSAAYLSGYYDSDSATVSGYSGNWSYSFSAGRTNKPSS